MCESSASYKLNQVLFPKSPKNSLKQILVTMVSRKWNQKKVCHLYNLMLYSLTGLACSLICWFCSFSKFSMKQFLFMYVPYIWSWSSFCSPMCLFIIANLIIVFLVGESNYMSSTGNSSSSAAELYDEYVQRSRRVRASNFPEKIEEKKSHHHDQMKVIEQNVKRVHQVKDAIKQKDKKINEEEEEEEAGLPAEELNKRAEEFIARVNKQRRLEARSLIRCKAKVN